MKPVCENRDRTRILFGALLAASMVSHGLTDVSSEAGARTQACEAARERDYNAAVRYDPGRAITPPPK